MNEPHQLYSEIISIFVQENAQTLLIASQAANTAWEGMCETILPKLPLFSLLRLSYRGELCYNGSAAQA